ncbi:unnamed protein product, partial [Brassica oleracea var. botrytis]
VKDKIVYEKNLEETATWAVAVVCFVLIVISLFIERLIHKMGTWLKKKHKGTLYEALEKVKADEEVGLRWIGYPGNFKLLMKLTDSDIRTKKSRYPDPDPVLTDPTFYYPDPDSASLDIRLFGSDPDRISNRIRISDKSFRPTWKHWENETKTIEYQHLNDQERFRFAKQTSLGRRHLSSWSNTNVTLWIVCFFRQFFGSVTEVDYKTLRHGFITVVNLITHFVLFYLLFSIK